MKPIQAIITMYVRDFKGMCGQQVGGDGSGDYAVIIRGDSIPACQDKIDAKVKEMVAISKRYVYGDVKVCYAFWDGYPNIEEVEVK